MLVIAKLGTFEKRNGLVEHSDVFSDIDVMRHRVREPNAIIGDARAHALSRGHLPPMLDVALHELPRRGAKEMLARHVRFRSADCHHVLELIAEPIGTARLIESGARPYPAGQRLI